MGLSFHISSKHAFAHRSIECVLIQVWKHTDAPDVVANGRIHPSLCMHRCAHAHMHTMSSLRLQTGTHTCVYMQARTSGGLVECCVPLGALQTPHSLCIDRKTHAHTHVHKYLHTYVVHMCTYLSRSLHICAIGLAVRRVVGLADRCTHRGKNPRTGGQTGLGPCEQTDKLLWRAGWWAG